MQRVRPLGIAVLSLFFVLEGPAWADQAQPLPGIILVDDVAGNAKPPVPLPDDADNVNYDASATSLEFESNKPPKELADFYRAAMKQLGWVVQPTVIDKDNMVNLEFTKGEAHADFTMMKMGEHTQFQGEGDIFANKDQANADATKSADASASSSTDAQTNAPLVAEDDNGLPIPSDHSSMGSENSLFRKTITATVQANIQQLTEFYRTELGNKGWKEQASKADIKTDAALMIFDSPDGPVKVKITRDGDQSNISLETHDQAAASKSPLFPKPGQIKVAIGNVTDKAAEVTIAGKKIKVPANVGSQKPDGPTLDLAPGKIDMAIKGGSKDSFQAGPDEIWMAMIGPGGILFVQAY